MYGDDIDDAVSFMSEPASTNRILAPQEIITASAKKPKLLRCNFMIHREDTHCSIARPLCPGSAAIQF
jgi:hypothetical protein